MKRIMFRTLFSLLAIVVIFQLSTCKLQQLAENSSGIREHDYLYYYLFIDRDIRNIPRVSDSYYFLFSEMDGPKPEVSSVIFRGGGNVDRLDDYFKSIGYHLYGTGSDKGGSLYQRWSKKPPTTDEIRIFIADNITVSKYSY